MNGTDQPQVKSASGSWKLFALGVALSAFSGLMFLLAFPPYGLWPLIWFGMVPALVAQFRLLPPKWTSLATAVMNLFWLGPFLARLMGNEVPFFFTYLGVWIAILSFLISKERFFHEQTSYRWFVLNGLAGFVGFEMVRATFIPLIATSGFVGNTQAAAPWLIQPVSIFSIYGLDLVITLVNFVLAMAIMQWLDGRWPIPGTVPLDGRSTRRWLVIAGAVLAGWVVLSLVMFSIPTKGEPLRVAALQPGYDLPSFQDTTNTDTDRVEAFSRMAREAAAGGARVIHSTEMMFNFDPQVNFNEELTSLAKETGAYLFITYLVSDDTWRNEAVMISPTGKFSQVYGKNHAFGEQATPTRGVYPAFETALGRLATLICHDGNYTDVARRLARNGAQLIAAPLNEFGGFGEQYWTNITLRAVENNAAMVVTAREAGTAIIDPKGRTLAKETNLAGRQAILMADVSLGSGKTVYNATGDILGWISMAAFVFFIVFDPVSKARAKKAAQKE